MYRLLFILLAASIASCNISVSGEVNTPGNSKAVKEDLQTGLRTSANGLSFTDHYLVNDKDEALVITQFQPGNKISIVLTGVQNFKLDNGHAFPGLSLTVTDASGKKVMETGNLFESYTDGFTEKDAATLRASLTIGPPLEQGDYQLNAKFWDTKSENSINSTLKFSVITAEDYD